MKLKQTSPLGRFPGGHILGVELPNVYNRGELPDAFLGRKQEKAMPTVLRVGSYRFHFYSDESREPAHIHVRSPEGECKFWLEPIGLARNRGIPAHDLREIERLVFEHRELLLRRFYEYHHR